MRQLAFLNRDSPQDYEGEALNSYAILKLHPRVKQVRDRRRVCIPRVLQRDIRRQLSFMFVNVVNGHDSAFIAKFMARFMAPIVHMKILGEPPAGIAVTSGTDFNYCTMSGVSKLVDYWSVTSDLAPDHVLHVEDVQLHTSSNSYRSVLRCKVTMSSTQLYDRCSASLSTYIVEKRHQKRLQYLSRHSLPQYSMNNDPSILSAAPSVDDYCKKRPRENSAFDSEKLTNYDYRIMEANMLQITPDFSEHVKNCAGKYVRYDDGMVLKLVSEPKPIALTGILSFSLSPVSQIEEINFSSLRVRFFDNA